MPRRRYIVTVLVVTERLEIIEALSQPIIVDPSSVIVSSAAATSVSAANVAVVGGEGS